jgi:acetoin utilization deacetylase AcuC-like enzyme
MKAGFLYDDMFNDHFCMHYHPECPERLGAAIKGLREAGLWDDAVRIAPREATLDELGRVHHPSYVEKVLEVLEEGAGHLDPDTFFSPGTRRAALHAAGGGVDLAMAVHAREVDWGWVLARPPGHHASNARPAGFCIFNNIAVATAALKAETDAERIAIFDWDVHHGNGTNDQFWDDPDVLFVSLHQWPHFPGSGLSEQIGGDGALGRTVNFPLPARCGDGEWLAVFDEVFVPLVNEFEPDHILVSAGFDAHADDPLAGMLVSTECYGALASSISALATEHCDGRLTLFLEGGYDLRALTDSCALVGGALSKRQSAPRPRGAEVTPGGRAVMDRTRAEIAPHWPDIL